MSSLQRHLSVKRIFKTLGLFVLFFTVLIGVWLFSLNLEVKNRIATGWFKPPVEIYSRGDQIQLGDSRGPQATRQLLLSLGFRERSPEQAVLANDFALLPLDGCEKVLSSPFTGELKSCIHLSPPSQDANRTVPYLLGFDETGRLTLIRNLGQADELKRLELKPILFAQFYEGEPILRKVVQVGDVPLYCLQAVTAIEDSQFLEHKGVSFTGLSRALLRNLFAGRYAQGGSTITQQLVKNYFLTSEKTIKRKVNEILMALVLEANADKDEILSSYLNVVYMGQRGPFQVIGLASASDYYFNKSLESLALSDCALLAAIINSPGRYNPFSHPEAALKRRNFVIDRMIETNMINPKEAEEAKIVGLPPPPVLRLSDPAPYFVQALFRELKRLEISAEDGLKIFSSLDIEAQNIAQEKVLKHVQDLEARNAKIKKLKVTGKNLEASLISVDVTTGEVLALVGGRQYVKTQYNRILDAHRQVGSIMKPFVYLTALENRDAEGKPYTALSELDDVAFRYKYEGQVWAPKNYTNEFYGRVPLYFALKNSLNVSTAQLGIQVGLDNIIDVARRAGVESEMKPFPALTLGAFEIYPWEVTRSALTLARMGSSTPLTFIRKIENFKGESIYQYDTTQEVVFAPEAVAVLVGMMKETFQSGTAKSARAYGWSPPSAGKTGTTSDTKDTWFLGFTPRILTLAWTGYDDNTPTGLTGASGALPLWLNFMLAYAGRLPADDFPWPESVEKFPYTRKELLEQFPNLAPHIDADFSETELIRVRN